MFEIQLRCNRDQMYEMLAQLACGYFFSNDLANNISHESMDLGNHKSEQSHLASPYLPVFFLLEQFQLHQ